MSPIKTVLFAWEMGGGLGHIVRAAAFAREFDRVGVRAVVALSDMADCALVDWPESTTLIGAPLARRMPPGFVNQSTYAELLYSCGYHDLNQVSGLVAAWFNLIDVVDADVLIADHAPAAHLAARLAEVPHARIGTGFFAPPSGRATPRFRTWHDVDQTRAQVIESRVLDVVNAVLRSAGIEPADDLGTGLAPDLELIASWPELDCYAGLRAHGSTIYVGNEAVGAQGVTPCWPAARAPGRRRIVAYLKADYPELVQVLSGLAREHDIAAYVGGLSETARAALAARHLWLASEPIDLAAAALQSDALLCHAGAGSAPIALAAGKPVLLLPYSAEQQVNAIRIAATGAGLQLTETLASGAFAGEVARFLAGPEGPAAAQALARRWSGRPDAVRVAVEHVMRLAGA